MLLDSDLSKKILKSTSVDKANKSEQDLSKIWAKYLSKKIFKSTSISKANRFEQDLSKIWAKSEQDIWVKRFSSQ